MTKRKEGFYWVVFDADDSEWEIAYWYGERAGFVWQFAGYDREFEDSDMKQIDERKIERHD